MLQLRTAETYIEDLRFERSLADGDEHRFIDSSFSSDRSVRHIFGQVQHFQIEQIPSFKRSPFVEGNVPIPPVHVVSGSKKTSEHLMCFLTFKEMTTSSPSFYGNLAQVP